MANLFERLGQSPPPTQTKFGANGLTLELQALHHWLQNWNKPTIRLRDIENRGPEFARKRERAIHLTERLVETGWLVPAKARRRDRKESEIVREHGGYPTARIEARPAPLPSD